MSHDFWPLTSNQWGPEEYAAIDRVVKSGQFTMDYECRMLEVEFAAYHGIKYGVMTNSGSSANLIAVASLFYRKENPLKRGNTIVVPALAWATTYSPLQQLGLWVIDIDIDTLNAKIPYLNGRHVQGWIGVPILGNPVTGSPHNIEDCCESLGSGFCGIPSGTLGELNTFSFFHSHQISAIEGGMVLTNDRELYQIMLQLRAHGWNRDIEGPSPLYRFMLPGYNVRPQEINAAIAREQLKKLPAMIAARRKNLKIYQELFGGSERWRIQKEVGKSSAFAFTLITNFDRAKIFAALDEAGIGYRMITGGCFTEHPAARYYDYEAGPLPNAMIVHKQGFFVGNSIHDLEPQLVKLKEVLEGVCR
jgi:CDP-4-dehydro-6-deoxyglucose reductase, E1